jgi:hypothetical protein
VLGTVRRGADARRVLLIGVTAGAEGTAAGRSAVVVLTGTNCPSSVWTNAGFGLNAFTGALAPTVYITTPEISAAVIPVAIDFISTSPVMSPFELVPGESPSVVPDGK